MNAHTKVNNHTPGDATEAQGDGSAMQTEKSETALDGTALHQALAIATAEEREDIMRETVRTQLADILAPTVVDDDSNFLENGLTSLTALELTRNLMTLTDVEIPLVAILEYPTPTQLGHYLAEAYAAVNSGDGATA
ncbi:acyl carrier protein [Streptomyces sp. DSM 41524]|uniref:Acyl carrier protein n=6 Tax=Streptomyces violaceusniger group TaxID=2839105 RepID=A0A6G4ACX7_9ACTN|nr:MULTISPECIES: acyl carrier protein [Streptomyces]MEE4590479.1 acyl carrier protein [Streptomyces sp. DSM 41524]EXU62074.1 phosphopantetheine-binding protein [Streptomyces sp. PRh5]MBI0315532.1 acyl carrier protein [Streptomyces javensis]NEW71122.1 acyl carrier protein [Streptomyces rhizosphaericus]TMU97095.1 phosphopantetheine-binding protein [Streptomyces sp. DASNCL29]